jgi:hypothetical protein
MTQTTPAATRTFASYCNVCDCRYVCVAAAAGNVGVAMEYEPDGFTPSAIRHVCWPREQRIGRLILARREAATLATAA